MTTSSPHTSTDTGLWDVDGAVTGRLGGGEALFAAMLAGVWCGVVRAREGTPVLQAAASSEHMLLCGPGSSRVTQCVAARQAGGRAGHWRLLCGAHSSLPSAPPPPLAAAARLNHDLGLSRPTSRTRRASLLPHVLASLALALDSLSPFSPLSPSRFLCCCKAGSGSILTHPRGGRAGSLAGWLPPFVKVPQGGATPPTRPGPHYLHARLFTTANPGSPQHIYYSLPLPAKTRSSLNNPQLGWSNTTVNHALPPRPNSRLKSSFISFF